jgi:phage virion morphogenesis protein
VADRITIEVNDREVLARLDEIMRRIGDPSEALLAIGETITEQTNPHFAASTAPDGSLWKPLAPATVLSRLNEIGRSAGRSMKPLIDSGILQDTIHHQLTPDRMGVDIGTNRFSGEWEGGAAVHQFGSRNGKIPARPFLGLSESDKTAVLDILDNYLRQALT